MTTGGLLHWQLLIICVPLVTAFDIFDKQTNLLSYIRGVGSLDPNAQTVRYGYGAMFVRFPGKPMQKIFHTEGFNVGRQVRTSTGFNFMAREFFVYRDVVTSEILSIWMNPFTQKPNEVFDIHNNPVDISYKFENSQLTDRIPQDKICFYSDVFLQGNNVLDPKIYPQYSPGSLTETNELYHYFMNFTELATTVSPSVPSAVAWFRRGPFLPWMEMGDTPGSLYYHQTLWKMTTGLGDVAPDILALVNKKYPEFLEAPNTFTNHSETSWLVFKNTIDERRSRGQPDIILPLVSVQNNATTKPQELDPKFVKIAFRSGKMKVHFNGTVYSEILGKGSKKLFSTEGYVRLTLLDYSTDSLLVNIIITGLYRDPATGKVLNYFYNPIKGETQKTIPFHFKTTQKIPMSSAYSFPLKSQERTSVFYDQSDSKIRPDTGVEEWAVNMVSAFVDDAEMDKQSPFFYGTWTRYTSWLPWFKMDKYPGHMVWVSNFYKVDSIPPP